MFSLLFLNITSVRHQESYSRESSCIYRSIPVCAVVDCPIHSAHQLHSTPWKRVTSYSVPAALPACPPGGCICAVRSSNFSLSNSSSNTHFLSGAGFPTGTFQEFIFKLYPNPVPPAVVSPTCTTKRSSAKSPVPPRLDPSLWPSHLSGVKTMRRSAPRGRSR